MRGVSQATRLRWTDRDRVVQGVPRAGDHARRFEPWTRRVQIVPRPSRGARARDRGGLRQLPRGRAKVGTGRAPALHRLPRAARRTRHAYLRDVPRTRDGRSPRRDRGRLRDVPSPARPGRSRRSPGVQDLPCPGHPAGAARRPRTRRVRKLPCVAPRASAHRSRLVHGQLPPRQARPSATGCDVRRMSRLPAMTARRRALRITSRRFARSSPKMRRKRRCGEERGPARRRQSRASGGRRRRGS